MRRFFSSTIHLSTTQFLRKPFRHTPLVALAAIFIIGSLPAVAIQVDIPDPVAFLEMEHKLSMEFETPHTKWAKPYAGGTLRVFFFVPWFQGSTDGREMIELMQRFDITADAAYYVNGHILGDNNPRWYKDPQLGTKRVLRLLNGPHDLFFLNKLTPDKLPEHVQTVIRENILNGAGLVMIGESLEVPYNDAEPIQSDATFSIPGQTCQLGKGRIVLLPPREKLEYGLGWETTFDYQMAEEGRAILWAANRDPRITLSVETIQPENSPSDLPREAITVTWNRPINDGQLRVQVRRSDGFTRLIGATNLTPACAATFVLPAMRASDYCVEVFASSQRGTENWAIAPFSVVTDCRVKAVQLERDWAEIGELLVGKVILSGSREPGDSVHIRLLDKRGRILAQHKFSDIQKAEIPFTFKMESWMPMLLRTEAVILRNHCEIDAAYAFSRVTKRNQNQFNFMVWNTPSGDLTPYGVESLARYGATMILQGGTPPLSVAASQLAWVPYAESFRVSSHTVTAMLDPETGILKNGCFWDEDLMSKRVQQRVEGQRSSREHGTFAYSLGDENAVRASCLSEDCLKAYRRYLEDIYGDIEALNKEWEIDYASFDQIDLLRDGDLPSENAPRWFKEYFAQRTQKNRTDNEGSDERQIAFGDVNDEMRALQQENFPRWYDRQAFQNYTYVNWCKRYVKAFRELDPQSWTGFEGTDSFTIRRLTTRSRQGGDLDAFVRETEYFGPYGGPANEVVRSIAPPNFPTGNWIGYHMDADVLLDGYWEQVTNCMNTVQWWRWDNLDGYHGFLSPTFAPFADSKEMIDDTQIVRDGLGTLLMQCQMVDDNIAMLYSLPSTYIAHFDGNRSYGDYKRDHKIWHDLIHEAGLQFRYVTDRMLRLDEFDASRYKILILPLAFAIGDKEAEVIREFVRQGGTVIADVRAGIYDEHCKPLQQGILDNLFGIKRTGRQDAVALDRMSIDGEIDNHPVSMSWGNWYGVEVYPQMIVDPTVTLTTGKELGTSFPIHYWAGLNHPVCVVNEYGKGRAILLNFAIYVAPAQSLLEGIFTSAGVAPKVKVQQPSGAHPEGVEITRWQNGQYELLALFGTYDGDLVVRLPQANHVYDLKCHNTLGNVEEFSTTLRPHRASIFALLPKEAPKPEIEFETQKAFPGDTVKATIAVPNALGNHAVQVLATTPDGASAPWLERKLIVNRDGTSLSLPFAYNDPDGQWTIKLVDLFTNNGPVTEITLEQTRN
ncbi:MAG: beta-galactosidase trimerization domain-containing protein [bacterium]